MHRISKLLALAATALAALALNASAASAQHQLEVFDEETQEACTEVVADGHTVTGGCHVEFEGVIAIWAHTPAETPFTSCHWHVAARLGPNGEGHVTAATLGPSLEPPSVGCLRAPCQETTAAPHEMRPWPFHLVEHGPGDEEVEATFCLRGTNNQEGTEGGHCEVHLQFTDLGDHDYEVGEERAGAGHEFCEVSPQPVPVSITNHLESREHEGEEIEVIHHPPIG